MLERLMALLKEFEARLSRQPSFGWAVVTSVEPLRIRYDAQEDPIAGTPDTLVAGLAVGSRVWCIRIFRRDIILGVAKGGDPGCPIGSVLEYAAEVAPAGWLLCHGQTLSRSAHAALFAAIGTKFGAGDGSTTFGIPDRRGRVGVGKSTDTEFNELGKKFGAKTHSLTAAQNGSHTHGTSAGGSTAFLRTGQGNAPYAGNAGGFSADTRTGADGSGQAHNNIQPSISMNYIIRAT